MGLHRGYIGVIYWENGKENGNYYIMLLKTRVLPTSRPFLNDSPWQGNHVVEADICAGSRVHIIRLYCGVI